MIRILFAAANPVDTDLLSLNKEQHEIRGKIRESDDRADFDLRSIWATRPDDLLQQMNEFRPNILHFSGHGSQANEIMLEDDDGAIKPVSKDTLQALFRSFRDQLYVVVLNACYSEQQAEELVEEVAVVIGMDGAIGDEAAIAFSASFYRALGFNHTIHDAFEQGLVSIQLNGEAAHVMTPTLRCNNSVDPRALTAESLPTAVMAWRLAEDPATPERIAALLRAGEKLILIRNDPTVQASEGRDSKPLLLELAMRESAAVFVVEVDNQLQIGPLAAHLAQKLLPDDADAPDYEWTLVMGQAPLPTSLTLEMAGVKSGERVFLAGNHKRPKWMPNEG